MKTLLKAAAIAALVTSPALVAAPAFAQAAAGQGTAVVDLNAAVVESAAYKAATAQVQTTYKAQIDAFNARNTALNTELAPARNEIQTLQQNPATSKATLDAKVAAFQARAQAAQAELQRLAQPFARPTAYAREQITTKIEAAVKAAMAAKRINLVLTPDAVVLANPGGDLTPDVIAQLNTLIKTASITPPAGWQPGQQAQRSAGAPQGR